MVVDVSHSYLHRIMCPDPTYIIQERERLHLPEDTAAENLEALSDSRSALSSIRGEGLTPLPGSFRNSWEIIPPVLESAPDMYTPTPTSLYMRDPCGMQIPASGMTIQSSRTMPNAQAERGVFGSLSTDTRASTLEARAFLSSLYELTKRGDADAIQDGMQR